MARKLEDMMAALPAKRRARIEERAMDLMATPKDLRKVAEQTLENLAVGNLSTQPGQSGRGKHNGSL